MSTPYPTATPVVFTPALLQTLDASADSAFSRAQRKEQALQKQVASKLDAMLHEEHANTAKAIEASLLHDGDSDGNGIGAPQLNAQLDTLAAALASSAEAKVKPEAVVTAEKALTACLVANQSRPLNCWDLVEAFKAAANAN